MTLTVAKPAALPHVGTLPDEFTVLPNQSDLNCSVVGTVAHCVLAQAISRTLFEAGVPFVRIEVGRRTAGIELPYSYGEVEYDHDGADIVKAFDSHEPVMLHPIRLRRHQYDNPAAA